MTGRPKFLKSAADAADFPTDSGREVAFVGRSNSGKSTAINSILGAPALARVSKTPGRTQLANFFEVAPGRRVVDLPGYGYARVPERVRARWRRLLEAYFDRRSLAALVVTVDIRRGLARLDEELFAYVAPRRVPIAVLLTKADKLSRAAGLEQLDSIATAIGDRCLLTRFSALDRDGIETARGWLAEWLVIDRRSDARAERHRPAEIKRPRVRDSGDTPGAQGPGGVGRDKSPAQGG